MTTAEKLEVTDKDVEDELDVIARRRACPSPP